MQAGNYYEGNICCLERGRVNLRACLKCLAAQEERVEIFRRKGAVAEFQRGNVEMGRRALLESVQAGPSHQGDRIAGVDDGAKADGELPVVGIVNQGIRGRIVNPEVLPPPELAPRLPGALQRNDYSPGQGEDRHKGAGPIVPVVPVLVPDEDIEGRVCRMPVACEEVVPPGLVAVPSAAGDCPCRIPLEGEDPAALRVILAAVLVIVLLEKGNEPKELLSGRRPADLPVPHQGLEPVELFARRTAAGRGYFQRCCILVYGGSTDFGIARQAGDEQQCQGNEQPRYLSAGYLSHKVASDVSGGL